eukprot:CAMPEP_0174839380 /NCGR_PEP_ID=MMETSP1114-20130205/8004_1 /TAXON_ID=312471 /ORGANISM="Neobodo designis, Strain CCAP 1951/1" /LENGTH=110 /DNA_ID=CAMNT_0016073503 /DNA_START=30 /DNA_END=362 /DNA_ORIENTATION=+
MSAGASSYMVPDAQRQSLQPLTKQVRDVARAFTSGTKHERSLRRLGQVNLAASQSLAKAAEKLRAAAVQVPAATEDVAALTAACEGAGEATKRLKDAADLSTQVVRDLRL